MQSNTQVSGETLHVFKYKFLYYFVLKPKFSKYDDIKYKITITA